MIAKHYKRSKKNKSILNSIAHSLHHSYVGRFAPSPTGPLHYGSLVTAVASYLQAKSQMGMWQVRIENIDPPREQKGATQAILNCLHDYGFKFDQTIIMQRKRITFHRHMAMNLLKLGKAYVCECTRKQLASQTDTKQNQIIYPGTCAKKCLDYQSGRTIRVKTNSKPIEFHDHVYGLQHQDISLESGDFVIYRGDDLPSYILAVSIDDFLEGYTEIVRGYDLLTLTPKQIYLAKLFGYKSPIFMHIPIITNEQGLKLSKQTLAPALNKRHARMRLYQALTDLGQEPPRSLRWRPLQAIWEWGMVYWDAARIPRKLTIPYNW